MRFRGKNENFADLMMRHMKLNTCFMDFGNEALPKAPEVSKMLFQHTALMTCMSKSEIKRWLLKSAEICLGKYNKNGQETLFYNPSSYI